MSKLLVTISLVVLLACSGMAFASGGGNEGGGPGGGGSGGGNDQSQNTSVNQGQVQSMVGNGGVAGNAQTNVQGIEQNYEASSVRVGMIGPQIPYQLHVGPNPNQIRLWNAIGFPYMIFQREWTDAQVTRALKKSGKWGAEKGSGFEKVVTSFEESTATGKINLQVDITSADLASHKLIGLVNVKAKKGMTESLALMYALKLAMCNGSELAVINPSSSGMNHIMNGTSIGPGVSAGTAGASSSLAGSLGFNLSDTKAQGEGAIILALFKKNGQSGAVGQIEPSKEATVPESPAVLTPPAEETQEKGPTSQVVPFDFHMGVLGFQVEESADEVTSESSSVRPDYQMEEVAKIANDWLSS